MVRRTIQYQPANPDGAPELASIDAREPDNDPGETKPDVNESTGPNGSAPDIGEFDPISGGTVAAPEPAGDSGSGGNNGSGAGDGSEPIVRRKRGRQPGTANKPKDTAKHYSQSLKGLESMLFGVHSMLAMITKTPELMLTENESALLAKAAMDVAQHYPIGASEKTMAWANLAMVAGGLYGSRVVAVIQTRKAEAAKRPTPFRVMDTPVASRGPQPVKPEAKKEQPMEPPTQHFHSAPVDSEAV